MAGRVLGPWNPARKPNGAADPGARLEFFENETTTPTEVYSSPSLAVSLGTFLIADAYGLYPTAWIANDVRVRVRQYDSDGVQVSQTDHVGPSDLGDPAFLYDFGVNGRIQAYGADGKVNLEAGDPSPAASGGDLRIGGWNGSPLDNLEIEAATVAASGAWAFSGAVDFTGEPTFNGSQVGSVMLAQGALTAGTEAPIPLSAADGYRWAEIRIIFDGPTGPATVRLSDDGGATYEASTNYNWVNVNLTGAYSYASDTGETAGQLSTGGIYSAYLVSNDESRRQWSGYITDATGGIHQPVSFSFDIAGNYDFIKFILGGFTAAKWALSAQRGI